MKYEPDRRGTGRYLNSPDMRDAATAAAGELADRARVLAPRDTGALAASIHVRRAEPNGGAKNDRAEAFVVADDDAASAVEFGHGPGSAQPFLRRAAGERLW